MATVKITIEADGTDVEITESSYLTSASVPDLDNVPALLGKAVNRAIAAISVGRDRANITRSIAEDLGVHVEYIDH